MAPTGNGPPAATYFGLQKRVAEGEEQLRARAGKSDLPLKCGLLWDDLSRQWLVVPKLYPDNAPMMELGREPVEGFPSDLLVAQIMLVA